MASNVGFVLSTGELLTIDLKVLPGEMDLEWAKGNLLYNFNSFFNDTEERNSFIENILAWPYTETLQRMRLSITQNLPRDVQKRWKGNSFQLACTIAFARGQGAANNRFDPDGWPSIIATGEMQRICDDLYVVPVGNSNDFNKKQEGASVASPKPDLWLYPKKQKLNDEQKTLNRVIIERGISVQQVDNLVELYETGVCPPPVSLKASSRKSRRVLLPISLLMFATISLSPLVRDMFTTIYLSPTGIDKKFSQVGGSEVMINMVSKAEMNMFRDEFGIPHPPGQDVNTSDPASYVSWSQANSFCEWLVERDPGIKSTALPDYDDLEFIYKTNYFVKPGPRWHEWSGDSDGSERLVKGAIKKSWNPDDDRAPRLGFRCKVQRG